MKKNDIDPNFRMPPKGARIVDYNEDDFEGSYKPQSAPGKTTVNPLQQYFRVPGISIHLPSRCYYYTEHDISPNINGEIDIFPMTSGDELILKNPDALMNGKAIELLIQSCVPQINNVRAILNPDIDAILLAIRAATLGNETTIDAKCPSCSAENHFEINIPALLDQMKFLTPPYISNVVPGLEAEIGPYNFEEQTTAAITAFEQAKKTQQFMLMKENKNNELDEATAKELLSNSLNEIIKVKYKLVANSILSIKTGTDIVTEKKHIVEFLENAPKTLVDKIVKDIETLNNTSSVAESVSAECSSCGHNWEVRINLNPSHFFE